MRPILTFVLVVVFSTIGLLLCAWLLRPDVRTEPPVLDEAALAEVLRARDVRFDPDNTPTLYSKELVVPSGQSPILQKMVDAGELPPVAERLPKRPIVMTGHDGIGNYGGTWLRIANAPEDVGQITFRMSNTFLVKWSPLGYPIEPHIAESVTPNEDRTQWTVKLREGTRWSDGDPYDADDIMYWWEHEANDPIISVAPPPWMHVQGKPGNVIKVDQYTVRFEFPAPYPLFLETLAQRPDCTDTPSHYLRKYHPNPEIGDQELIEREVAQYKLPSKRALYRYVKHWQNPEHPRLWPWVYRTFKANPPQVFVRNPYYAVVDSAGNQLPYIDRLQFEVQDGKMLALSAANGGVTMQGRHLRFADYTEMMTRRATANTRVLHWYPAVRSTWVINPNLNRRIIPGEPQTRWKAELLSDKRFRQALSLAIDRKRIIRADQSGIGEPSQVEPGPESPFHSPELKNAFIDFDPARANAMLDELGLTRRDSEGYRTFRNGQRMTFFLDTTAFTGLGPAQFVVDDWSNVGVRVIARERARPLFYAEKDSLDFDFNVWSGESDYMPLLKPRYFIPADGESFYAVGWGRWYMRGGFYNTPASQAAGNIPVPRDHPMYRSIELFEQAIRSTDLEQQIELMREVMQIAAENVWSIGIATAPPVPIVVSADLRNVPENALWGVIFGTPANAGIETYFFANPLVSSAVDAEVRSSILVPTLRPGGQTSASGVSVGGMIRWLVIILAGLSLLMIAVKHPFVGRRLLIMIPTLAVISVIVFTIIQLPPGDYITQRIMVLQESGDPTELSQIDDLREQFHMDDPGWKLYLRWVGLWWFTSFSPSDEGLLQGNLGRSMETQQPINNMVGDRLMLTVAITAGTIVFTWLTALPIGIYSAVRQYSVGDYVLTLFGFIGMCVPAFLLALVMMAISDKTGLFSPEYAAQPNWTWGKVWDLMTHIWIPILVLGVGGTAGMIRIMRANLLDELRKPYVITAMAKGVRPTKLLLKYPVRLALNPFISGLGGLFPQLISGGAIVALVLALPTVGPLMVQALFTEDMYLAGSMLMVLSLLGIIGTLVSDLLLLWLDPRIRLGGGSR